MDKARFLIETHLRTGRPVGELAKAHGVHRSWLYKLLARYRREGPAGLEPRSKRPKRSPARVATVWDERIVKLRKELLELGMDAGAETIRYHLCKRHRQSVPSSSTIWRVLKARGFVTPQPHKRPKSSWTRFVAEFPNECWQADVTHVEVANGVVFEVLNVIDDHSRLCVASRAFVTVKAPDVVRSLHKSAEKWGYPESFLTDNGLVFSSRSRHGILGHLELVLLSLGISSKHSRPYHPQTCGKVERFHQTLKKYLAKQEPPVTKKQLQVQLDWFVSYYNEVRPHRAIGRRTPLEIFFARERSYPQGPKIDCSGYKVRTDKVDKTGSVTLRYRGRLHHIGIGRPYAGWRVVMLVAGLDVRVIGLDGSPLRHLTLDPTKDYQPQG
ncbi:MAG TPA: IS481 family transposase [Acidimicrobiales bacterium]|nr:IS481 family transposase [Acidimicrobiales bacterium]